MYSKPSLSLNKYSKQLSRKVQTIHSFRTFKETINNKAQVNTI